MRAFSLFLAFLHCAARRQNKAEQAQSRSFQEKLHMPRKPDVAFGCREGSSSYFERGFDMKEPKLNRPIRLSNPLEVLASLLLTSNHAAGWRVFGAMRFGNVVVNNLDKHRVGSSLQMNGFKGFGSPPPKRRRLLRLVPYEDPKLRMPSDMVSFPLSNDDSELIDDMLFNVQEEQLRKAGAFFDSAAGMAAPQWGKSRRIFVVRKQFMPKKTKIKSPGSKGSSYMAIINPEYKPLAEEDTGEIVEVEDWEGCFSVPGKEGKVKRFRKIEASFQAFDKKTHTLVLEGVPARVFQHETDHLNGKLYDDKAAGRCSEFRQA